MTGVVPRDDREWVAVDDVVGTLLVGIRRCERSEAIQRLLGCDSGHWGATASPRDDRGSASR